MIDPPIKLEINVGPVKDVENGVKMLKMATILGQNEARMQLARIYLNGKSGQDKDTDKAYRHISTGAVLSGNPVLLAAQGFLMLQGIGTKQDTQNGLKLIQAAAARGYPHAKALLGYAHYRGLGVEKNVSNAILHLEEATTLKDPFSLIYLALLYDEEKQPEKSQYYLNHAERVMPDKATTIFNFYKQNYQGWHMTPFPL
jgi:TPR repeat protein